MALALVLVRLKLVLLRAGLRTAGIRGVFGLLFALLLAVSVGLFGAVGIALTRVLSVEASSAVIAGAFAVMLLVWVLGPIVTAAAEGTLEVDKLVLFPIAKQPLMLGLLGAAIAGFGGLATALVLAGAFVGMAPPSPLAVITVVALVLQLATCATCSRLVGTAISGATKSRRWRDIVLFAAPLVAVGVNLAIQLALRSSIPSNPEPGVPPARMTPLVEGMVAIARLLPSGPSAFAVGYARAGRVGAALVSVVAACLVLVALLVLWERALHRTLTRASITGPATRGTRRELFPAAVRWLPRQRVGAVAAKDMRLMWRDPRQRAALIGSLAGAVLPLVSLRTITLRSPAAVLIAAVPAYFLSITATNLYGYDGMAHWTNVAAGDDARADLTGKLLARIVVMVPLVALGILGLSVRSQSTSYVPGAIALAIGTAGVGLGVGVVTSVRWPFPWPTSTTNVFSAGNSGAGMAAALPTLVVTFGGMAIFGSIAAAMVFIDAVIVHVVLSLLSVAIGLGAFVPAFRWAVRWSAPRQPELLFALQRRNG